MPLARVGHAGAIHTHLYCPYLVEIQRGEGKNSAGQMEYSSIPGYHPVYREMDNRSVGQLLDSGNNV